MDFKWMKNIALVLFVGLIYIFGSVEIADAQPYLPQDDGLKKINELAEWTDAGKKKKAEEEAKKKAEEEAKKKQEGAAPEGIAKPKTSQEVIDGLTPWRNSSASSCSGDYQPENQDAGTTPNSAGLFSPEIMVKMQAFMRQIYKELSKVFMIGHSLLCYSQKVAYLCIGIMGKCFAKLANLNLFVSGMLIYVVGVLMTMSIGMYFVDISFKLGFAMLFMPVSIALWPFPPTKNKFQENLSIIIRNGMLFTLVAIGVTFAVTLISNSLLDTGDGRDGWEAFWQAIADKKTEVLIDNFAFDRMHFLVVAFGLIFGFKILASSVNDYLDYFFSDSVFGSESPMHHMGTQAVGMVAANTVKPAASFIGDVAKTQTGRAIAGVGGGIAALGSKEGRSRIAGNFKKFGSAVANPRRTIGNAVNKLETSTKKAVGSGLKGITNVGTLILPIKESTRKKLEQKADDWIDNNIRDGKLRNLAADTAAFGVNTFNQAIGNKNAKFVTRDDIKNKVNESIDSVKDDLSNLYGDKLKENVKSGIVKTATKLNNEIQGLRDNPDGIKSEEEMREIFHQGKELGKTGAQIVGGAISGGIHNLADKAENTAKNTVAGTAAMVYNDIQSLKNNPQNAVTTEAMRMLLGEEKQKLAQATKQAWKEADKAPISLQPSAILSTPFKVAESLGKGFRHPINSAVNNLNKLAAGWEKVKQAKEQKIILKTTGQIVLSTAARTVKGTGQDIKHTAEGTASVLGNVLKDFGKSLQNNKPADGQSKHKWTSWQDMHDAEQRKKEAAQEDRDYFKSINTYDDD